MKHVYLQTAGPGWIETGPCIGEAESIADAELIAIRAGYKLADNADEYDSEDAPRILGYEPDGRGAYIVAVLP